METKYDHVIKCTDIIKCTLGYFVEIIQLKSHYSTSKMAATVGHIIKNTSSSWKLFKRVNWLCYLIYHITVLHKFISVFHFSHQFPDEGIQVVLSVWTCVNTIFWMGSNNFYMNISAFYMVTGLESHFDYRNFWKVYNYTSTTKIWN